MTLCFPAADPKKAMLDLLPLPVLEQVLRAAYGDDMHTLVMSSAARACKRFEAAARSAARSAVVICPVSARATARCRGVECIMLPAGLEGDDTSATLLREMLGAVPAGCSYSQAWPRLRHVDADLAVQYQDVRGACESAYLRPATVAELELLVGSLAALEAAYACPPSSLAGGAGVRAAAAHADCPGPASPRQQQQQQQQPPPPPQHHQQQRRQQLGLPPLELDVRVSCLEPGRDDGPSGAGGGAPYCTLADVLASLAALRGFNRATVVAADPPGEPQRPPPYSDKEEDYGDEQQEQGGDSGGGGGGAPDPPITAAVSAAAAAAPGQPANAAADAAAQGGGPHELYLSLGMSPYTAAWLAPLTAPGAVPRLEALWLNTHSLPMSGRVSQAVVARVACLTRLTELGLRTMELAATPGHSGGGGGGDEGRRPVLLDLSPLTRLERLERFMLGGGSASIHRLATMRTVLRPLTTMPALQTVTLELHGRRWSFDEEAVLSAEELRRWVADERCRPESIVVGDDR